MMSRSAPRGEQDSNVWLREQLPEWQQRLQQIKRPLAQVGITELHLYLVAADTILQLVPDQPPIGQNQLREDVAAFLSAQSAGDNHAAAGCSSSIASQSALVLLSGGSGEPSAVDIVLSLGSRDPIWSAAPELAWRLWHAEPHALPVPAREQLGLYRAQALAAANESEFTDSLPANAQTRGWFAGLGARLPWLVLLGVILLAGVAMVPVATPIKGQGTLHLAGVSEQSAPSAGIVAGLMVGVGAEVQAGQPLYWLERPEQAAAADAAYLNWAAQVRQRLLSDGVDANAPELLHSLAALRAAESARKQAILAPLDGRVLALPELGTQIERGAAVSLVMPAAATWQLIVMVPANDAHLIQVGDRASAQAPDGRWLLSQVEAVQPLALSVTGANAADPRRTGAAYADNAVIRIQIRAPSQFPAFVNQSVPVRIDATRLPLYRQLLRRWRA